MRPNHTSGELSFGRGVAATKNERFLESCFAVVASPAGSHLPGSNLHFILYMTSRGFKNRRRSLRCVGQLRVFGSGLPSKTRVKS